MNLLDAFFGTNDKDNVIKAQSEQIVRLQAEILELNEAIDKVIKERDKLKEEHDKSISMITKVQSLHDVMDSVVNDLYGILKGMK